MEPNVAEVEKVNPFKAEVDAENAKRTGKGLRQFYGNTRGKGSIAIKYEAFDDEKPETLPESVEEFNTIVKPTQSQFLQFLIEGYNALALRTASDPIAEFVTASWDDDTKAQFRLAVRNLSKAAGLSIEQAVALVKPAIEAKVAASV